MLSIDVLYDMSSFGFQDKFCKLCKLSFRAFFHNKSIQTGGQGQGGLGSLGGHGV